MITVLKFYADWCGPCKALEPTWNKLQEELKNEFIFQSVDIESNPQERARFFIRSIPTIIMVKKGEEIARRSGGSFEDIKDWLYHEQGNL